MSDATQPVLVVDDLRTHFFTRAGVVKAVDGVSFSIGRGRVLGLVGESGSGKSLTGFSIMGMVDAPGRIVSGRIRLGDTELTGMPERNLRHLRGGRIAMIFQDPMMALNPVLRIGTQMIETIAAHQRGVKSADAWQQARAALGKVGIPSPEARMAAYPHQFSGGMRQRVAIAMALLNHPDVIVADEPTTALDVTIQAQILHEVRRLCRESGTALLWITHDLSVISGLANEIAVMYAGKIVEVGPVDSVLDAPAHPYTRGLLNSVPARNRRGSLLAQIPGVTPPPIRLPAGCSFRPRCPRARPECTAPPPVLQISSGRAVRCIAPHVGDAS